MNRSGLVIALVIGVCTGVLFAFHPRLDLDISAPFFDAKGIGFWARGHPGWLWGRWVGIWLPTVLAIAIVLVLVVKLVLPRRRMLIPGVPELCAQLEAARRYHHVSRAVASRAQSAEWAELARRLSHDALVALQPFRAAIGRASCRERV